MDFSFISNSPKLNEAISIISTVIAVASAICAATPTPATNTVWGKIYRVIEFLAINLGKAKQVATEIKDETTITPVVAAPAPVVTVTAAPTIHVVATPVKPIIIETTTAAPTTQSVNINADGSQK